MSGQLPTKKTASQIIGPGTIAPRIISTEGNLTPG